MKPFRCLVLFVLTPLIISCGAAVTEPCAGSHSGAWTGSAPTAATVGLTLSATCAFSYSDTGCSSAGTYNAPLSSSGSVLVTITSSTGGACLGVGDFTCDYVLDNRLAIDCGAGAQVFSK